MNRGVSVLYKLEPLPGLIALMMVASLKFSIASGFRVLSVLLSRRFVVLLSLSSRRDFTLGAVNPQPETLRPKTRSPKP